MSPQRDIEPTHDGESDEGCEEEQGEYSRRSFMETAAAVGAAGAATGLAGCGELVGGDDGAASNGEQDFLFWTMRGYIDAEEQAIRDTASGFEDVADDPINFQTEVITWDNIFEEWEASLQGRELPNVSEMACEHAVDFGNQGAAMPVTDLYDEYDDWYDSVSVWGQFDGDFWGIPWFLETRTTHANTDMLDEAGVDIPTTWAEMVDVSQTIVDETDASTGWATPGARDGSTGQNLVGFTHQSGGSWFGYEDDQFTVELDSPPSLFAHLWQLSMREQWDFAPGGWGGTTSTELEQLYREGTTPLVHVPTDLARDLYDPIEGPSDDNAELAEATELAPAPEGPNGESQSFMGGSCLSPFTSDVTSYDADDQLSLDFIDYMTQPDTLDEYFPAAQPTFMPVRSAQEENELYQENPTELPDSWIETRQEQAPSLVRYGISGSGRSAPFFGDMEGSTDSYAIAMSAMIGEDADAGQALVDMANDVRDTISEADYIDYELEHTEEPPSLDDAPDIVQPWIEGDGVPQIYTP